MKATTYILAFSGLLAAGTVSAQQKKEQSPAGTVVKSKTNSAKALKSTAKPAAATGWNMVRQARETTFLKILQADGSYQQEAWYVYPAEPK
jgi:hypothetical protein